MVELLTALLVMITAVYVWVTFRILKANERAVEAMRDQSEAMNRPYVTVSPYLEADNPVFYLRVSNVGKTAAADLRLEIDRPFYKFGQRATDHNVAELSAFKEPIAALTPESNIYFHLAQGFVIFSDGADESLCPVEFKVTATYRYGEKRVAEVHHVDLRPFRGAAIPQEAIVRKLKAIDDSIRKLVGARGGSS